MRGYGPKVGLGVEKKHGVGVLAFGLDDEAESGGVLSAFAPLVGEALGRLPVGRVAGVGGGDREGVG